MVRWEREELQILAKAIAQERMKDVTSTATQILKRCQKEVLPTHRQRTINSIMNIAGLDKLVKQEYAALLKLAEQPEPKSTVEYVEPDEDEVLASVPTWKLISQLAYNFGERLDSFQQSLDMISHKIEQTRRQFGSRAALVSDVSRPLMKEWKPLIAVTGIPFTLFRVVENRVKGLAKLCFAPPRNSMRLPDNCYAVVSGNQIDHDQSKKAKDLVGDANFYFLNGGVKAITEKVLEIANAATVSNGNGSSLH